MLEQAELTGLDPDLLDEIFGVLVRDFSGYATDLHRKVAATDAQAAGALANIRRPAADPERFARVWSQVEAPTRFTMTCSMIAGSAMTGSRSRGAFTVTLRVSGPKSPS